MATDPGVRIVALAGEHDLSTAGRLREDLQLALAGGMPILVDLSEVTFVDSSVIGVLVAAHRTAAGVDGQSVSVVAPEDGAPARLLDLIGARHVLQVFESRDAAVTTA